MKITPIQRAYAIIILTIAVIAGVKPLLFKSPTHDNPKEMEEVIVKKIGELKSIISDKGAYNMLVANKYSDDFQWFVTFLRDVKTKKWNSYFVNDGKWQKQVNYQSDDDPSISITLADFDLMQLIPLFQKSKNKIVTELKINELSITGLTIMLPKQSVKNLSEAIMQINICPKSGGTEFKFTYDLKGNLKDFDYNEPVVVNGKPTN